jgi:phenylpropionate dioxygenase-like ring-hydroxylating dioxygenase large terminal subunit
MSNTQAALRDYWHPVALSSAVQDKPVPATLLDEQLVLWRSKSGVVAARDLCAHRGTRLSLGWIDNDQLVCPYHGWCYNAAGAVTCIPSIPVERPIPTQARVPTFRCTERYGLIFVCLGEPRRPIYEMPEYGQDGFLWHILGPVHWKCGAARSFENFIDEAHLPWVHSGMLGNRSNVPPIPTRDVKERAGAFYFEYHSECRNRVDPTKTSLNLLTYDVLLPFELYHENVTPDGERVLDLFYCTPNSEKESTRYMIVGRNFALGEPADKFVKFTSTVWEQDRVIVETQRPEEVPLDLTQELHLRGPDGPSVIFRRMLRQLEGNRAA